MIVVALALRESLDLLDLRPAEPGHAASDAAVVVLYDQIRGVIFGTDGLLLVLAAINAWIVATLAARAAARNQAVLRAVGATPRQTVTALVVSQLVACAIAVVAGIPLGLGLRSLMEGGDLPAVSVSTRSLGPSGRGGAYRLRGDRQRARAAAGQAAGRAAAPTNRAGRSGIATIAPHTSPACSGAPLASRPATARRYSRGGTHAQRLSGLIRGQRGVGGGLGVAEGLDYATLANLHEVDAADRAGVVVAEPVAPADDRSVAGDDHILQIEAAARVGRQFPPEGQACVTPLVARAVRRRLDGLHDAVVGHQVREDGGVMLLERVVEPADHLGGAVLRH
jgi:hypothetical protein